MATVNSTTNRAAPKRRARLHHIIRQRKRDVRVVVLEERYEHLLPSRVMLEQRELLSLRRTEKILSLEDEHLAVRHAHRIADGERGRGSGADERRKQDS